jgi:hypothetical protein
VVDSVAIITTNSTTAITAVQSVHLYCGSEGAVSSSA